MSLGFVAFCRDFAKISWDTFRGISWKFIWIVHENVPFPLALPHLFFLNFENISSPSAYRFGHSLLCGLLDLESSELEPYSSCFVEYFTYRKTRFKFVSVGVES